MGYSGIDRPFELRGEWEKAHSIRNDELEARQNFLKSHFEGPSSQDQRLLMLCSWWFDQMVGQYLQRCCPAIRISRSNDVRFLNQVSVNAVLVLYSISIIAGPPSAYLVRDIVICVFAINLHLKRDDSVNSENKKLYSPVFFYFGRLADPASR